jgi:putative transposase
MGIKSTRHAVYDLKYHLVWVPKYRKHIFDDEIRESVKEVFQKIAEEYEFEIDTMEVMEDHVHVFIEAPPRYSPSQIVQIIKSISAREIFKKYPKLRKQLWAHELWNDGYFVRSVGDKVTADIIRKYIEDQTHEVQASQFKMFEKS